MSDSHRRRLELRGEDVEAALLHDVGAVHVLVVLDLLHHHGLAEADVGLVLEGQLGLEGRAVFAIVVAGSIFSGIT